MPRNSLTDRILDILVLLADRPYTQSELADYFEVSTRTIRDDMTTLMARYPIIDEPAETDARVTVYRYMDGYRFTPPTLMPAELAALLLAQEAIAQTGITGTKRQSPFGEASQKLIAKVRAALPEPLRNHLDALSRIYGSSFVPAKDFAPHAATVQHLTAAALDQTRIRLTYHSLNTDETRSRLFEPYAVYFDPDGATLKTIGVDVEKNRLSTFSVDRIQAIDDTTQSFVRPPDFDLHAHLTTYCFNGIHGEPLTITLRATGATARVFAERSFHPSQRIIEHFKPKDAPERITITMTVARGRGLERFILSYAPEVEVLAPPALRSRMRHIHTCAATTNLESVFDSETHE